MPASAGGMRFEVTAPELRQLYVDLKGVEGNLRVELRRGIKDAADGVVAAVVAASSWSTRIPGAVRAKPSFSAKSTGVSIVVDGKAAPEAKPLNNRGRAGQFRHPVHANPNQTRDLWTWAEQPARPFFDLTIAARSPAITRRIEQVADDVARKAGFK